MFLSLGILLVIVNNFGDAAEVFLGDQTQPGRQIYSHFTWSDTIPLFLETWINSLPDAFPQEVVTHDRDENGQAWKH